MAAVLLAACAAAWPTRSPATCRPVKNNATVMASRAGMGAFVSRAIIPRKARRKRKVSRVGGRMAECLEKKGIDSR